MKSIPTAKQITFLYFSIVAFAIIAIHASVFELTTEDIEQIYAQKRLDNVEGFLLSELKSLPPEEIDWVRLNRRIQSELDSNAQVYYDRASLPERLRNEVLDEFGVGYEVVDSSLSEAFFFSKVSTGHDHEELFIVLDNRLYELSEDELYSVHTKQILVSFCLLLLSFWVVLKISERLTQPLSNLTALLNSKATEDLKGIDIPDGVMTQELVALVDTLNVYRARVESAIQRERSFNRYVSHELRSPLMVMKGAIQLLTHSNERAFIEKQQGRLFKATQEMQEFIETLLELTKTDSVEQGIRTITAEEITRIVENQRFLINSKPVTWQLIFESAPQLPLPEAVLHILLGNLIKNAFAYTDEGEVTVTVSDSEVLVSDTGMGLSDQSSDDGYGLGLLLVKDICHRYCFDFDLKDKDTGGCIARIRFNVEETPSALTIDS